MDSAFGYQGLCEKNTLNTLNWCRVSRETLVKWKKADIICQFPSPADDPAAQRSTSAPAGPGEARAAPGVPDAAGPLEGCLQPSFHGFWSKPPLHILDQLQIAHGNEQSLEMLQGMHQRAACRGLGRVFGHYPLERWDAMLGVLQDPGEQTRNHSVMDSQNGLGYKGPWW